MSEITFKQSDTVVESLQKVEGVVLSLLSRNLEDSVRGILANLGTCVAVYIHQVKQVRAQQQ